MISVNNLHKEFKNTDGSVTKVLSGITYEVEKGEKIVIVGPSGSGKSTFLRCLNLLERPTSGEIYFDAEEITNPKININKVEQYNDKIDAGYVISQSVSSGKIRTAPHSEQYCPAVLPFSRQVAGTASMATGVWPSASMTVPAVFTLPHTEQAV